MCDNVIKKGFPYKVMIILLSDGSVVFLAPEVSISVTATSHE